MATGNSFKTDLYKLYNYSQNSFISYPKEIFIETLREVFAKDSYYHYVKDNFGYPLVTDHTNQLPEAGIQDDSSTRIFIGEAFRNDASYYPHILVKNSGARGLNLSFNRDKYLVQWENLLFEDGYGNQKIIKHPAFFSQNGIWEGTITLDVAAKSPQARDEIVEIACITFVDINFDDLKNSGIVVKPPSIGSASESEDRTGKAHKQSINFEYRYEWHREIPIRDVIDVITFCFDIGQNQNKIDPNLSIQFQLPLS